MASRIETDIEVFCHTCEKSLGYVVEGGHTQWLCEDCTESVTGRRKVTAVDVEVVPGVADSRINGPIGDAYARYDSDARVNGPGDFEAFADAVEPLMTTKQE